MSWAGIASNQEVTRSNLQDGVDTGALIQKATITGTSSQCVTKSNVESFIYVNAGDGTWAGYASNQLTPKSAIQAACSKKKSMKYSASSCSDACSQMSSSFYYSSTYAVGGFLYTNAALTTAAANGYYTDGTYCYRVDSNQDKLGRPYIYQVTSLTIRTLSLYGRMGTTGWPSTIDVQYSTVSSSGPWSIIANISGTTCNSLGSVTTCDGSTIWLMCTRADNSSAIFFNTSTNSTCPSNSAVTCLPSIVMSADATRAITIYVSGGAFIDC